MTSQRYGRRAVGNRGPTLALTPWSRSALTIEERDAIMARALSLGVHVSLDSKGPRGPFRALGGGRERGAWGENDIWDRTAYGAAMRLLDAVEASRPTEAENREMYGR